MRMLARLINHFFVGTAILLFPLIGATSTASTVSEKELSEQLKYYENITELETSFQQTKHLSEMNLDLKSEGRMAFKKPEDVTWEILKPSPVTVKMSNKEIQISSGSGTQVYKFKDLSKDNIARGVGMLKPWLTLDAHALSEQYRLTKTEKHSFLFEPKSSEQPVSKMQLTLASSGQLEVLKLFEKSGDWMEIKFGIPKVRKQP